MRIDARDTSGDFLDVGGYAALIAIGAFAHNVAIAVRSIGLAFAMEIATELRTSSSPADRAKLYTSSTSAYLGAWRIGGHPTARFSTTRRSLG
jgi:hypothetical protein